MEKLTATTKELIFEWIKKIESEKDLKSQCISKATDSTEEFIEFWTLEIELLEKQIELLKEMLFTK